MPRLALLLLLVLLPAAPASAAPPPPRPEAKLRLAQEPRFGDLDEISKRRALRVLVPFSKTLYFVDEGGTQRGLSYEFMQAFEERLNQKQKRRLLRIHVVFLPTARGELLNALEQGLGDVAVANLTVTPARSKRVDFTRPLASNVSEYLVTGPGAPPITGLDDLAGREVFVRRGTAYRESLEELSESLVARGLAPIALRDAPPVFETEDMLEMANAGLYPTVVADSYLADFWSQVFEDLTIHRDLPLRSGRDIAIAIRKDSPLLKAELDEFIAGNAVGSGFGNVLLRRYLKNTRYVRSATNRQDMRRFREFVGYFQRYGERYSVDWLLMVAQGYQESRLDQGAVSPVGAIGVMQLMPATGKDMQLDISQPEGNIHAGIKYVRWLIDNYFDDPALDEVNRMLLAFAAYNAGPGRVRQLRRAASERGLDPNQWFNHVEHVAAEKVGRETVQYVSNIYKYYIAYQRVAEQREARRRAREAVGGVN